MTNPDSSELELPRPFIPEPEPTSEDYFLSLEFLPRNPNITIDPEAATGDGTRYLTKDGRLIIKAPSNYDAVEVAEDYFRYTVSVPEPEFEGLASYLEEAQTKLTNALPASIGDCTLRIYLAGRDAVDKAPESGITEWASIAFDAESITLHDAHDTGSLATFTLSESEPVTL